MPGGGSGGQGNGGTQGGTPVPADACRYTFVYRQSGAPGAPVVTGVRTAGSFEPTPWAGELRLEDPDADGFFTADVALVPGRYEYKFVVQAGADAPEQWVLDPDNPQVQDDGRGNTNSIVEHTCPFLPECLADADCEARAPGKLCRFYACVDASSACECEAGFHCDAAGGCVPDPQCDAENPCADPLVCRAGVCGPECTGDAECDAGDLCRDFTCVTPECMVDADCGDPLQRDLRRPDLRRQPLRAAPVRVGSGRGGAADRTRGGHLQRLGARPSPRAAGR